MFENLTDKLQRAFKNLRGQGTLTEENIGEALKEIRMALLEADVNFNVVKELIEHIREKALGAGSHDRALALRAGHQDRSRRTHRHPRQRHGQAQVRLAAADRRPHGGPAGFRQNHHFRQARALAQAGRTPPHARLGRRLPSRRARAAQSRRRGRQGAISTKAKSAKPTPPPSSAW